jgi:hypothetical protein
MGQELIDVLNEIAGDRFFGIYVSYTNGMVFLCCSDCDACIDRNQDINTMQHDSWCKVDRLKRSLTIESD